MAIDPSIIGGLRPVQIDSPVNALAQVLRVQGMQQETQLGQAKLDEYQRSKTRQNKLLQLVQGLPANTTDEGRLNALKGGGYFDEADKLETGMLNRQKTGAEVKAKEWEAQSKKLDLAGQAFGYVRQNPTMEAAHQVLDYLGANGVYPPETVAQFKGMVAADPTKIASLADTAFRTVLGAKEQLMKVDTRNLGGTTQTIGTDPLSGQTKVLSTAVNTQSPDNAATVAAARDNADATRAVAAATRAVAEIRRDQDTEMKLADDYRNQSKPFKETSDAYKQLNATLDKATTSPAATLAGATKFMKLLDPGSVVRESELGMALAATGVLDRAGNYFQHLKLGKVLTPAQVKDFKNITQQIYAAAQDGQRAIDANYRNQAKTYGLRPEVIIQDLGQNTRPAAVGGAPNGGATTSPDIDALLQKYGQ